MGVSLAYAFHASTASVRQGLVNPSSTHRHRPVDSTAYHALFLFLFLLLCRFCNAAMLQVVLGGVMQAWGVQPNQLSYNTIMDAYARQGNVRNVVKIYNFMQVRAPRAAREEGACRVLFPLSPLLPASWCRPP